MQWQARILSMCILFGTTWPCSAGVVIVAANSEVDSLDRNAIKRYFLGREATLDGHPTQVLFLHSGMLRDQFDRHVLEKPEAQLTAYWSKLIFTGRARAPLEAENAAEAVRRIAELPGAIGYVDESALDASVKVVFEF